MLAFGQLLSAQSKGKVLMISGGGNNDDYMIIKEFGVMKTTLSDAGFTLVLATKNGQLVQGKTITVMPDLKLSDVQVADYKG
jgi:hypothetical protein